jgi:Family of unknown function (DUF5996)
MKAELLPELPLAEWRDTLAALHMWSQIVGKIRLAQTPLVNHLYPFRGALSSDSKMMLLFQQREV